MIVVASSLSLLAIVAGMFLYAKTIKDNLNLFYKIVASFIIIIGFLNLFVGSAAIMVEKVYKAKMHHNKMENKLCGSCGKKLKKHNYKQMSCEKSGKGNCDNQMESNHSNGMCSMGGENFCSSMMNKKSMEMHHMMMKKDSVMKK